MPSPILLGLETLISRKALFPPSSAEDEGRRAGLVLVGEAGSDVGEALAPALGALALTWGSSFFFSGLASASASAGAALDRGSSSVVGGSAFSSFTGSGSASGSDSGSGSGAASSLERQGGTKEKRERAEVSS
jgi:hypothetical protein